MNIFPDKLVDDEGNVRIEGGISIRDYMATICAAGILANPETPRNTPVYVAVDAYKVADALLNVRHQ